MVPLEPMDMHPLINKTVDCRFSGAESRIALSHALFSSYDIDSGTRLLLKSLAEKADLSDARRIADVGCGTGVIGIALAKAFPEARVTAVDRDALALAFTEMNARDNGLPDRVLARAGLLSDFGPGEVFDRIVSNLPAKAGREALSDFLKRAPLFLSPGGSVWIVIVNTLAKFAESEIAMAGHEILWRGPGKEHCVFGFRSGPGRESLDNAKAPAERLAPYNRGVFPFSLGKAEYELECARDIPDFDTPGYGLQLCVRFLESRHCAGFGEGAAGLLVWNPGQGHVPLYCAQVFGTRNFVLAGRDWLELLVSSENLRKAYPEAAVAIRHAADPACLSRAGLFAGMEGSKAIIAFPDIVPGYAWAPGLFASAASFLGQGESIVVQASSAALSCLDKKRPEGFSPAGDKREKSNRAVRFSRRPD